MSRPRGRRRATAEGTPATCRRASPRGAPTVAAAEAWTASWVSTTPVGEPVVPLVATTSASPGSTPRPSTARPPWSSTSRSGAIRPRSGLSGGGRQPSVDRERSVARVPDPSQCVDESVAAGKIDRNKVRHGQKATVTAVNRWILGARPRTLPAAVVPVAIGAGAARRRAIAGVVAGRSGTGRQPRAAGRRQLRQRLQRRSARHRRCACRPGPPGRRRTGDGRAREARCPGCLRRRRGRRVGVGAGDDLVADRRGTGGDARRVGLHRRARSRTATSVSARCSCSCSSVSSRPSAPPTSWSEEFPAHGWVAGGVAGFLACALLVVNNLRDIPTDRSVGEAHAGRAPRRQAHPLVVRRLHRGGQGPDHRHRRRVAHLGGDRVGGDRRRDSAGANRAARCTGRELIPVLAGTARTQLVVGLLLALGLALRSGQYLRSRSQAASTRIDALGRLAGGRRGPHRALPRTRPPDTDAAICRLIAANFVSSSPAIASTGMFISRRRGHSEPWAPVPACRRLLASPSAVLRRRSARCSSSSCETGEQRLCQPLVEEGLDTDVDDVVGQLVVGGSTLRRARSSSAMPGVAPIRASRLDEVRVHQRQRASTARPPRL